MSVVASDLSFLTWLSLQGDTSSDNGLRAISEGYGSTVVIADFPLEYRSSANLRVNTVTNDENPPTSFQRRLDSLDRCTIGIVVVVVVLLVVVVLVLVSNFYRCRSRYRRRYIGENQLHDELGDLEAREWAQPPRPPRNYNVAADQYTDEAARTASFPSLKLPTVEERGPGARGAASVEGNVGSATPNESRQGSMRETGHNPSLTGSSRSGRVSAESVNLAEAVLDMTQELADHCTFPIVGEAATLLLILVNLFVNNAENNQGLDGKLKRCRSIVHMLRQAAKVLGKVSKSRVHHHTRSNAPNRPTMHNYTHSSVLIICDLPTVGAAYVENSPSLELYLEFYNKHQALRPFA